LRSYTLEERYENALKNWQTGKIYHYFRKGKLTDSITASGKQSHQEIYPRPCFSVLIFNISATALSQQSHSL
jgi:hypothetical protein